MAIVVHRGSGANAGHYHAAIRDVHHEVDWNPEPRKRPKFGRRRRARFRRRGGGPILSAAERATAILVSILSDHEHLTINKLSREFNVANESISWSLSFQSQLGDFRSFVRNHHRFRVLDESRRTFSVALAADTHSHPHSDSDSDSDSDSAPAAPPKVASSSNSTPRRKRSGRKTSKRALDDFVVDDDAMLDIPAMCFIKYR